MPYQISYLPLKLLARRVISRCNCFDVQFLGSSRKSVNDLNRPRGKKRNLHQLQLPAVVYPHTINKRRTASSSMSVCVFSADYAFYKLCYFQLFQPLPPRLRTIYALHTVETIYVLIGFYHGRTFLPVFTK